MTGEYYPAEEAPFRGKNLHVGDHLDIDAVDFLVEKIEKATKILSFSKMEVTNHLLTLRSGNKSYKYQIGYGGARWIGSKPRRAKTS